MFYKLKRKIFLTMKIIKLRKKNYEAKEFLR